MSLLIIDVGSSSVRALLMDDDGELIPGAVDSQSHAFRTDVAGMAVCDPNRLRLLTEGCIDQVLGRPEAVTIRAVGMATFVGNVMGLNAVGHVCTPLYTYADTQCAADVEILEALFENEAVLQRTGCRLHTAYQPARLHWLRRTQPEIFNATRLWLDFGAFLYRGWLGQTQTSYSVASWSGLLNRAALDWDRDWLDNLGLTTDQFPPLADFQAARRGLQPEYAKRWPALREVPFFLAVGDGAAANIGSGATDEGRIALTVGTTAALRYVTSARLPTVPSGLWCYRVDATRQLIGGATTEGGNIFAWARQTLKMPEDLDSLDLEQALLAREADAHGLTMLPLLAGERCPGWAKNAVGTIHGLRLSTTPLDIMQAALESVALRLSLIADQMTDAPLPVMAGGGALAASAAWAQIMCDALNRPVHLLDAGEITACGVARLVLESLDGVPLNAVEPSVARVLTPRPHAAARLQVARERQRALYEQVLPK